MAEEPWLFFQVAVDDEIRRDVMVQRAQFIVAARNHDEAATTAAKASTGYTLILDWRVVRVPDALVASHASQWPARLPDRLVRDIYDTYPNIIEQNHGYYAVVPIRASTPTPHAFLRTGASCVIFGTVAAGVRWFAPPDLVAQLPAFWSLLWLSVLLGLCFLVGGVTVEISRRVWSVHQP
jgi:hypothetical protein